WPASSTRGSAPRSTRCATAARPTGPAPMTTTGCWWSVVDTLVLDTATTLPFASTSVDPLRDQDGTCFDERQHRHLSKPEYLSDPRERAWKTSTWRSEERRV